MPKWAVFLIFFLIAYVLGGSWGLLMLVLLPVSWGIVASLIGGAFIGFFVSEVYEEVTG